MKRTYQPKKRQNKKEHGFMKRMSTRSGRNVIKARRAKGREKFYKKHGFIARPTESLGPGMIQYIEK